MTSTEKCCIPVGKDVRVVHVDTRKQLWNVFPVPLLSEQHNFRTKNVAAFAFSFIFFFLGGGGAEAEGVYL